MNLTYNVRHSIGWMLFAMVLFFVASCGGGGDPPVTPPPHVAHSIDKVEGDGQTAPPGSLLPVAPMVVVRDDQSKPMADIEVSFAVTAGNGTVQVTSARTDTEGRVSCAGWTLGPGKGINTLTAGVEGLAPVVFSAKAANTSADVTIKVIAPKPGQTVPVDTVEVVATVTSTYQLANVTASVDSVTVPLEFVRRDVGGQDMYVWNGVVPISGPSRRDIAVIVTATDLSANSTDAIVPAAFDLGPVISVSAPLDGTVARHSTKVTATCADDDPQGCASVTAYLSGRVVASGTGSIDQLVNFGPYEGRRVSLSIVAKDSRGTSSEVSREVFVESSPQLIERAQVNGFVWDASGTRVLYLDTSDPLPTLKISDSANGSTQTVMVGAGLAEAYGFLTSTGAIFVQEDAPFVPWLYEWRAGVLTRLQEAASLGIAGDWAIFSRGSSVWRRDLGAGTSTLITNEARSSGLGPNGDVVYGIGEYGGRGFNIYRWRDGSVVALTNDPPPTLNVAPVVTDGQIAVFCEWGDVDMNEQRYKIALHDGTKKILLTPNMTAPLPSTPYAAAGGYAAYPVEDGGQVLQIWRHGPSGEEQLSFSSGPSTVDAIATDGTVLLRHISDDLGRYRAKPGFALQKVGSSLGRVVVRDGKFLVLLGRSVFEVGP
jgi:hypothetical protein